ncbi:MAG: alpha/beta hydrolase [Gammaproteobacteria bacterium]|nr:alpha/beta hydrolase [Gammaproteobacteria bacterium]
MQIQLKQQSAYAYTTGRDIDPNKPTVMFVHGTGLNHTVWTLPARYFGRHGFNVLAVDLPGHGRSDGPLRPGIEGMADFLIEVLDALKIDQAALVGHSMGSLVVFDAAARYPDRARSLALLGTALPMGVTDALLESAKQNKHDAIDMLTIWGYSQSAQLGGNETPGMWMVGGTMRLFEQSDPGVIYNGLNACNEYSDGLARAQNIQCPSLLILGDRDIMTPPFNAKQVAEKIPDSKTMILPGTGHSLMSEKPDAVLDALITIV